MDGKERAKNSSTGKKAQASRRDHRGNPVGMRADDPRFHRLETTADNGGSGTVGKGRSSQVSQEKGVPQKESNGGAGPCQARSF